MKGTSVWVRYGYLWVTLILFVGSLAGHWTFGWYAYVDEERAHEQPVEVSGYAVEMLRDTFENWQSEFLQLMWQVAGLAYLFYVGSPQSKEGSERTEEKLDEILKAVDPKRGKETLKKLDRKYARI